MVHEAEKNVKEHGDQIPSEDKSQIESDIAALKEVSEGDDAAAIEAAVEALTQSMMKIGEIIYKAQQDAAASEQPEGGEAPQADASDDAADGEILDADFEEVDDDKKAS